LNLNGHTITNAGSCFGSSGIHVEGTPLIPLTQVHILGPGTIDNFGEGFLAENSAGSFVKFVTVISQCPSGGGFLIQSSSSQWKLQGNVAATPSFGIVLRFSDDNDLVGNDVNNGMLFIGSNNNTVVNNTANNGFGSGIALGGFSPGAGFVPSSNNEIHANTTNNNSFSGIKSGFGSTGNNITGNNSFGNIMFDMDDENPNCDSNKWKGNHFNTANQSCIN
jgi:hypothetical protein